MFTRRIRDFLARPPPPAPRFPPLLVPGEEHVRPRAGYTQEGGGARGGERREGRRLLLRRVEDGFGRWIESPISILFSSHLKSGVGCLLKKKCIYTILALSALDHLEQRRGLPYPAELYAERLDLYANFQHRRPPRVAEERLEEDAHEPCHDAKRWGCAGESGSVSLIDGGVRNETVRSS